MIPLGIALIWATVGFESSPGLRALLALAAAGVLVWPAARGAAAGWRARTVVLLSFLSVAVAVGEQLPDFVTSWKVRVWNVYHYYLGAKYFRELGYTDLYRATLRADEEGANYWRAIDRVRNLHTYEVEPRDWRLPIYDPEGRFEPERWQTFRREVEALSSQRPPERWSGIFVDRGYNATPFWTVVGSALTHLAPATRPLALKVLCGLDLLLLGATFAVLWRTFGSVNAALVLLLFTATPVNVNRLIGGFLQYDWFCAVVLGICCYSRGRPVAAAGAFAYASLTRVFPVLFVAAGALPVLVGWLRNRRLPARQARFLVAFVVWCVAGLAISLPNGRGVRGWGEFVTGIRTHKEHHLLGERRVGLQFLFTHRLGSFDFDESREERALTLHRQRYPLVITQALLLASFLVAAGRERSWNAQLLALVPIFALLVTSRYYWSYLALLPLTGGRRGPPAVRSRWLGAAQLLIFSVYYLFAGRIDDPYAAYVVLNGALLVYLVFALSLVLRPSPEVASA